MNMKFELEIIGLDAVVAAINNLAGAIRGTASAVNTLEPNYVKVVERETPTPAQEKPAAPVNNVRELKPAAPQEASADREEIQIHINGQTLTWTEVSRLQPDEFKDHVNKAIKAGTISKDDAKRIVDAKGTGGTSGVPVEKYFDVLRNISIGLVPEADEAPDKSTPAEPETESAGKPSLDITLEDCINAAKQELLAGLPGVDGSAEEGKAILKSILKGMGAARVTELKDTQFNDFMIQVAIEKDAWRSRK